MRTINFVLTIIMVVITQKIYSQNTEVAKEVAINWMNKTFHDNRGKEDILKVTEYRKEGALVYYNVQFKTGGYVLVSGSKNIDPIIAFSKRGRYKESLAEYNNSTLFHTSFVSQLLKKYKSAPQDAMSHKWDNLTENISLKSGSETEKVFPLVQTQWGQSEFYNESCPYDFMEMEQTVAGCNAVSIAQVLKYFNYPSEGAGHESYTPKTNSYLGVQSVNYEKANYNYGSMPNRLFGPNKEVAKLIYHSAVAVHMDFTHYGSSSALNTNLGKVTEHFGYNPSAESKYREDYSDDSWITLVKEQIDKGVPLIYRGEDNTFGGHSFICDGYIDDSFFHFNWGWEGRNDGYYNILLLNPSEYGFTDENALVYGFVPSIKKAPVSNFGYDLSGTHVVYYDNSRNVPTAWGWQFPGGTPQSSSKVTPFVRYANTGIFKARMVSSNQYGKGEEVVKYINIPDSIEKAPCKPETQNFGTEYGYGLRFFSLANIENTSGTAITDSGYVDFSSSQIAYLYPDSTYSFVAKMSNVNGQYFNIFIDYNDNGLFETTELVYKAQSSNIGFLEDEFHTAADPITNKMLRMRIVADPDYADAGSPCNDLEYGQAEDYGVVFYDTGQPELIEAYTNETGTRVNLYFSKEMKELPKDQINQVELSIEGKEINPKSIEYDDMDLTYMRLILQEEVGCSENIHVSYLGNNLVSWNSTSCKPINQVSVNNKVNYIYSSKKAQICEGETITINGVEISTAGTYSDTVSGLPCDSIITTTLKTTLCDKIKNNQKSEKLKVYPIPVGEYLTIEFSDYEYCQLFDITGNLLRTSYEPKIDFSILKSGIYIVRIIGTNGFESILKVPHHK